MHCFHQFQNSPEWEYLDEVNITEAGEVIYEISDPDQALTYIRVIPVYEVNGEEYPGLISTPVKTGVDPSPTTGNHHSHIMRLIRVHLMLI